LSFRLSFPFDQAQLLFAAASPPAAACSSTAAVPQFLERNDEHLSTRGGRVAHPKDFLGVLPFRFWKWWAAKATRLE
jgi:hypothetical protein